MTYIPLRPAIAMVELIFAIVVMGISMLSIPLMLESATKSSTVAFQQESIAIIASHANSMMTYAWDESNTQDFTPNSILTVTDGDDDLDGNTTVNQANQLRQRDIASNATPLASFGLGQDDPLVPEIIADDIDDFDQNVTLLKIAAAGTQAITQGEYMDIHISMRTAVTYLNDTADYGACAVASCEFSNASAQWDIAFAGTSNIKLITTTLTSSNVEQKQILLRSFMCNIGAARPNRRGGF